MRHSKNKLPRLDPSLISAEKLVIFDTHPIQYRSPVFRVLAKKNPKTKVFFFNESFDGNRWWFHEVGKIPSQKFGLVLDTGFPNSVLGTRGLGPLKLYRMLKGVLTSEKPSAVLIYGYYLPEHWILRRLCAKLAIPILFIGETFSQGKISVRWFLKQILARYYFHGVTEFIAIGNRTVDFYRSWKVSESRITAAKYCTDVSFFQLPREQGKETRTRLRRSFGIPEEAFVVHFVGRLFERKRPLDDLALHE